MMKITTLLTSALLIASFGVTTLSANQAQAKKPFLIQGELPHLSGMVQILWDDEDLALTKEQKEKLSKLRKETVTQAKALGKRINALEAQIVQASADGVKPETLKESVSKLASLRAEATIIHLECIYKTRHILSQDQLDIVE